MLTVCQRSCSVDWIYVYHGNISIIKKFKLRKKKCTAEIWEIFSLFFLLSTDLWVLLCHEAQQQPQAQLGKLEPLVTGWVPHHEAVHQRHRFLQHLLCPQRRVDQALRLQEVLHHVQQPHGVLCVLRQRSGRGLAVVGHRPLQHALHQAASRKESVSTNTGKLWKVRSRTQDCKKKKKISLLFTSTSICIYEHIYMYLYTTSQKFGNTIK